MTVIWCQVNPCCICSVQNGATQYPAQLLHVKLGSGRSESTVRWMYPPTLLNKVVWAWHWNGVTCNIVATRIWAAMKTKLNAGAVQTKCLIPLSAGTTHRFACSITCHHVHIHALPASCRQGQLPALPGMLWRAVLWRLHHSCRVLTAFFGGYLQPFPGGTKGGGTSWPHTHTHTHRGACF